MGAIVVPRQHWLTKAARLMLGPRSIEPRKGASPKTAAAALASQPIRESPAKLQQKQNRLATPGYALESLAARDDIIFSIRRTIKNAIGELPWKIVPDLDEVKADLKRWYECTVVSARYPEWGIVFRPQAIQSDFFIKAQSSLRMLLVDELAAGADPRLSQRLHEFFDNVLAAHEAIAESHTTYVRRLFEKPNPSAESSFRALLDLIVDDLTLYDMAALIKNPRLDGTAGELYTIPGSQVRVYKCPDLSTPAPPYPAYDWSVDNKIKGFYNNYELVLMMLNQQPDFYGRSPMEVLIEQMVGSIYGDAYLSDWFQQSNMPFFVFDLGPNVDQPDRDAIEMEWNNKVVKGRQKGIFIAAREGVKGFIPMNSQTDKSSDVIEKLKYWANRKCAAYGLSLNDIGFTEDLHLETSKTQKDLTQSRGVNSVAVKIESYFNGEVLDGMMWLRNDPENPNDLTGKLVPCFPFNDCKFSFVRESKEARLEDAQQANIHLECGVLAINEQRKELGLPPVDGGDEHVIIKGGAPIKVSDLPNLPAPVAAQDPAAAMPGEEDGEEGQPPSQNGRPPQQNGRPAQNGQPPKSKIPQDRSVDAEKRVSELVDRLAKLATPTNGKAQIALGDSHG